MANALRRIEAAAARIEVAAQARPFAEDPAIVEAHSRLRAEAGVALAELDALIGSLQR